MSPEELAKHRQEYWEALSKGLEGFAESSVKAFNNVFETRTSEAIGAGSDFIGAVARGMHNNQNNVKQEVKEEIQEIIDSVLSPIKDSNLDIEDAVKKIIESQIEIINSYTGDGYAFYNAGDNAVQGLINGIKSRIQDAKTAGFDLGYAVYEGTKEGLQEKSPSHIMRDDAAFYAVKGLVLGVAAGELLLQIVNLLLLVCYFVLYALYLVEHLVAARNCVALIFKREGNEAVLCFGEVGEAGLDLVKKVQGFVIVGLKLFVDLLEGVNPVQK